MTVKNRLESHGLGVHRLGVIAGPAIVGFVLERFGIPLPVAIGVSVGIQATLILTLGLAITNRG
jgi:hypothetical protein